MSDDGLQAVREHPETPGTAVDLAGTNVALFSFNIACVTFPLATQSLGRGRGRRAMQYLIYDCGGATLALEHREKLTSRSRIGGRVGGGILRLPADGDVGSALRSVFEQAMSEDIPPEMLDLLKKLG